MPERINTPFTNEHFAAFCLSMLGQPYWYGTVVYMSCWKAQVMFQMNLASGLVLLALTISIN